MRALTWQGRQDSGVETVPDPKIIEPTDAVVRITSTGICRSDLHHYKVLGPYLSPGDVLGHEPMGTRAPRAEEPSATRHQGARRLHADQPVLRETWSVATPLPHPGSERRPTAPAIITALAADADVRQRINPDEISNDRTRRSPRQLARRRRLSAAALGTSEPAHELHATVRSGPMTPAVRLDRGAIRGENWCQRSRVEPVNYTGAPKNRWSAHMRAETRSLLRRVSQVRILPAAPQRQSSDHAFALSSGVLCRLPVRVGRFGGRVRRRAPRRRCCR